MRSIIFVIMFAVVLVSGFSVEANAKDCEIKVHSVVFNGSDVVTTDGRLLAGEVVFETSEELDAETIQHLQWQVFYEYENVISFDIHAEELIEDLERVIEEAGYNAKITPKVYLEV